MPRLPPSSALFPYTTLFRSRAVVGAREDDAPALRVRALEPLPAFEAYRRRQTLDVEMRDSEDLEIVPRSEEHTSELQSRLHLVCRLLLEKKKYNEDALVLAS